MLPRDFTEEQTMFRDTYRRFLAAEIVPHMETWREQGRVDPSAFRKAGEQGLLMVWPDVASCLEVRDVKGIPLPQTPPQQEAAMSTVTHSSPKGDRTIRLPLAEAEYEHFLTDGSYARERLQELSEASPELFPAAFARGYAFYGFPPPSRKQQLRCRRLLLPQNRSAQNAKTQQ